MCADNAMEIEWEQIWEYEAVAIYALNSNRLWALWREQMNMRYGLSWLELASSWFNLTWRDVK